MGLLGWIWSLENLLPSLDHGLSYSVCNAFISSPEQRSRRVILLPPASASTNVKVFVKVFKTSLFPNLITDLVWWKFCAVQSPPPAPPPPPPIPSTYTHTHAHTHRSCQNQGHRLRIFQKQNVQYQASYPVWWQVLFRILKLNHLA